MVCGLEGKSMQCFFWESGVLRGGIQVELCPTGHLGILLGSSPSNPSQKRFVCLHKHNPPDIRRKYGNSYIDDAYPVSVRPADGDVDMFFVLAKPHEKHTDDDRVLVQVSTYADNPVIDIPGYWAQSRGDVETIESGTYENDAGQRWYLGLLRLAKGSVVRVRSEGRATVDRALYVDDEGLHQKNWTQFQVEKVMRSHHLIPEDL